MTEQPSNLVQAIRPGHFMPDFRLRSIDGPWVSPDDFVGRRFILVFTGWNNCQGTRQLLREIRGAYPRIVLEETIPLLIAPEEADTGRLAVPPVKVPFPVLRDVNASVHRAFGAVNWGGQPAPSVFITDHHRRVIYRALSGLHERLPSGNEIVSFLVYDELACSDCGQPNRLG
ncbi:MAG TPA: redoxin domain-containing protein [Chloroflexota bacterium]|nr:redoxin domain-containing protein [Chloroflexota bacterium]